MKECLKDIVSVRDDYYSKEMEVRKGQLVEDKVQFKIDKIQEIKQ
jgi:hypothetical protein